MWNCVNKLKKEDFDSDNLVGMRSDPVHYCFYLPHLQVEDDKPCHAYDEYGDLRYMLK